MKALVCAATLAAGLASSMAQSNVYSLNVVGYVNVPVVANNFYLLNNPLDVGGGDVITNVFPINDPNFDSSIVFTYAPLTGLTPVETYFGGFGWYPGTNVLVPGTGFYLYPTETTNITFVGSVITSNTITFAPGFSLVGSAFPASLSLTALGITNSVDSDLVYRYSGGGLNDISTYFGGYGWYETTNGNPVDGGTGGPITGPSPNVAEGFFYYNANENSQGNEGWSESFTVN
jgi:hypothetical protein